ncbi:ImuA family protein [Rhodopseudomonas sp. NSM]|uniref:ImuA family protein n=1 Tax=Rhodopseudomonas sp. NSM TaxID=3457630 RepID=UPI00403671B8
MDGARLDTLARLQGEIDRLETGTTELVRRVSLGHSGADAVLQGGLALGALHEVFAEGRHSAAATGFVAGLARRLAEQRFLLWIRSDFSARENGELAMEGFAELGLDPRRIVMVRAHDADSALRAAADALACNGLGAVVTELWGETRAFDLVASRKLTLAAQQSGVTALMLRIAAQPQASTAETRWVVRAAHSPPIEGWGAPVLETSLIRNRHGQTGRWIMEWNCDACRFREPQTHPRPLAAAAADRSYRTEIAAGRRLAG